MPYYLGIDPGKKGAIALLRPDMSVRFIDHKKTIEETARVLYSLLKKVQIEHCVLEKVNAFGMGRTSAFSFGSDLGMYRSILAVCNVYTTMPTPQEWQKATCGKTGGDKNVNYEWLKKQFNDLDVFTSRGTLLDGRTDALTLALYAKKLDQNG